MKKLLLIPLFFITLLAAAQDRWTVKLNNKTLVNTTTENEKTNSKTVRPAEWKQQGYLEVVYKEAGTKKEWRRSIFFCDENDNELIRKDDVTRVKIPVATLKKTFAGKTKINIFTTVAPTDPDLAARVRIRRVHLCTLVLP